MKIALYIEDGLEQIVLTPQSPSEKNILERLHDGSRVVTIRKGSFYSCQGGYVRQSVNNDSSMIVLEQKEEAGR